MLASVAGGWAGRETSPQQPVGRPAHNREAVQRPTHSSSRRDAETQRRGARRVDASTLWAGLPTGPPSQRAQGEF